MSMRSIFRARPSVLLLAAAVLAGCGAQLDPTQDITTGEAIIGLSDAINALREDDAVLQSELDSLRAVVARQDTAIARLAAVAGVTLPPR